MNNKAAQSPTDAVPLASEIARQVDGILGRLIVLLATKSRLLGIFAGPLYLRIIRVHERLLRLLGNLAAGRLPRPHTPRPTPPARSPPTPAIPTPQAHLWIIRKLGWQAVGCASQLSTLLHAPGVAATIATSPGATRTLRPLCRLLGIDLPTPLRLQPRPEAPPRPARRSTPPTPHHPPDRPLPAYVRAAVRAWKRHEPKTT